MTPAGRPETGVPEAGPEAEAGSAAPAAPEGSGEPKQAAAGTDIPMQRSAYEAADNEADGARR